VQSRWLQPHFYIKGGWYFYYGQQSFGSQTGRVFNTENPVSHLSGKQPSGLRMTGRVNNSKDYDRLSKWI
jgi:hypothetical protein